MNKDLEMEKLQINIENTTCSKHFYITVYIEIYFL